MDPIGPDEEPANQSEAEDFDIADHDLHLLRSVEKLVKANLGKMSPGSLHSAAAFLLALKRLPRRTLGVDVSLSFSQPNTDGNYGWTNIYISEDEIQLDVGEHFYDPGVGGDTETQTLFEAVAGGSSDGDVEQWIEFAEARAQDGYLRIDHDNSDHNAIEWDYE